MADTMIDRFIVDHVPPGYLTFSKRVRPMWIPAATVEQGPRTPLLVYRRIHMYKIHRKEDSLEQHMHFRTFLGQTLPSLLSLLYVFGQGRRFFASILGWGGRAMPPSFISSFSRYRGVLWLRMGSKAGRMMKVAKKGRGFKRGRSLGNYD